MSAWNRGLSLVLVGLLATPALAQGPVHTPRVHALTGVKIWQGPGRVIENGTIVIRDGIIEGVGESMTVPDDARVWELDSLTVYPGLIDLGMVQKAGGRKGGGSGGKEGDDTADAEGSLGHELDVVTPQKVLADDLVLKDGDREARRGQGITTARVLPGSGAFRGQAAVANLGDGDLRKNLLERSAGQVLAFSTARNGYPGSTMGVVAVMRQTFYDTRWHEEARQSYQSNPVGTARPEASVSLEALAPAMNGKTPLIFITRNVLDLLRADEMSEEFGLEFDYLGSGEEYKRLDEVGQVARNLVIPVNFPEAPTVEGEALGVSLEELRAWDNAPGNPHQLHEAGIPFALTADGLKDTGQFRKNVRRAIEAGLPEEAALAAVTTVPAGMIGMSDRLGTVDAGKIANLVVTDGEFFAEKTKVRSVWIDGDHYEVEEVKPPRGDPRGTWDLVADAGEGERYPFTLVLGGEIGALSASIDLMGNEIEAEASQSGSSVVVSFSGDSVGLPGMIRFSFDFKEDTADGSGMSPQGAFTVSGNRTEKPTSAGGGTAQ